MIELHEITLADKAWIDPLLRMSDFRSEEYNFTFMFIWKGIFGYRVGRIGDFLILKAQNSRRKSYLYPPGSGDVVPVLEEMRRDAEECGNEFVLHTVLAEQKALLEVLYPGKFEFHTLTDYFDYIYDAQSLITLAGKKLHAKRNHINRFRESFPDWSYEAVTGENMPEVMDMSLEWCVRNNCMEERSLRDESCVVQVALDHYAALGMDGGLIRAGDRVVAFSMGERLNSDTYLVHIEKAFSDVQGAYAVINQQFAARNCADFLYINREDDSGQEGLRKAKLSYRPVMMAEKYSARWKG